MQDRLQQQSEQLRQELQSSHRRSSQQLQSRLTELETTCKELTDKKYKNESAVRDLKMKLVGAEEVSRPAGLRPKNELISHRCVQEGQRLKQQVLSLRRENGTLDAEVHDKERLVNQLQMKVAVLEQEVKDKEQLMRRTKEVLEAAQQQKVRRIFSTRFSGCAALVGVAMVTLANGVWQESVEENAESKEVQVKKLEATVKSLSEELIKVGGTAQTRIQAAACLSQTGTAGFSKQSSFCWMARS